MFVSSKNGGRLFSLLFVALFASLFIVSGVLAVASSVTVTPATGGSALVFDGSTFTALSGPSMVIAGNALSTGTVTLTVPTGYVFDTSASVKVRVLGSTTAGNNVNGLANNSLINASVSSSTISFTITAANSPSVSNTLKWEGVKVRPTSGSAQMGNITYTGNATLNPSVVGVSFGTLKLSDTTAPVITVPVNSTVEATGASGKTVTYSASATDAVDGAVAVVCSPASGSTFALGTTTVTCSAHDVAGNTATASFSVTVVDTTAPSVNAGTDKTTNALVAQDATASDAVGIASFAWTQLSGTGTVTFGSATSEDTTIDADTDGSYVVQFNVTDTSGNSVVDTLTFVKDTFAPVVAISADVVAEATSSVGATVTFSTPSGTDALTGSVTVTCSPVSGSTFALGNTTVTCSASDGAGNSGSSSFTISVVDTTAPVLALNGSATVILEAGSVYTDDGATATDNYDSSFSIVVDSSALNTLVPGNYTVTYDVIDSNGNVATQIIRTVTVVDTTAPSFGLVTSGTIEATSSVGADVSYSLNATDIVDGSIAGVCSPTSGSTFGFGTMNVSCTATDAQGNVGSVSFTVTVQDTTAPALTLTGNASLTIEVGSSYVDAGATASDAVDGDLTVNIVMNNTVDANRVGSYTVTYDVTDSNGNVATQITRTVTVVDTTAPVITLTGASLVLLQVGENYTDDGATATDNYDGALRVSSDASLVNTLLNGTYTITYSAFDSSKNRALSVTRTVVVGTVAFTPTSNLSLTFTDIPTGVFNFTVTESSTTTRDMSGFLVGSTFFDVTPSSNLVDGTFNVTLVFSYADANNDGIVDGTSTAESELDVYFFNVSSGAWAVVSNPVRDSVLNTLTVTVDHFTLYSLLAVAPASSSSSSSGSGGGGGGGGGGSFFSGSSASGTTTGSAVSSAGTSDSSDVVPTSGTNSDESGAGSSLLTGAVVGGRGTWIGIGILAVILIGGYVVFRMRKKA